MAKKRPTLDAFLNSQENSSAETGKLIAERQSSAADKPLKSVTPGELTTNQSKESDAEVPDKNGKAEIIRHMLYLPLPVYDQLQALVFEEQRGRSKRRKTHDYLLDAIDLLFKEKGLKSIGELVRK